MDIVRKFEMMWPSVDQSQQNKIYGQNPQDKLGLYGDLKGGEGAAALSRPPAGPASKGRPQFGKKL